MRQGKRVTSIVLCAALAAGLSACGGDKQPDSSAPAGDILTDSADGYGGPVTVTLTRSGGVITACTIQADQETQEIGGKALAELEKQVVAANGWQIDGVSGATMTTRAVKKAVAACLGETYQEEVQPVETADPAANVKLEGGLQIGQALGAAHGTGCFTQAYAVVQGDVVVAAYLDDFQFIDADMGLEGVPNSDADFGEGYAEGKVLVTKRTVAPVYSQAMAERGGATKAIDLNFDAIQNHVNGMTIEDAAALAQRSDAVDVVSGATLADTAGYVQVIVNAAKS